MLRVAGADARFYPDVVVVCGEQGGPADGRLALTDATVVVEVESRSTSEIDRTIKLNAYRKLPSLAAYVLIAQDYRHVEVLVPDGAIGWTFVAHGAGETVALPGIDVALAVDEFYDRTDVPLPTPPHFDEP